MRIISDFKDYYDSLQGIGDGIVYVRKAKLLKSDGNRKQPKTEIVEYPRGILDLKDGEYNCLHFCGKVYRLYHIGGRCYYNGMKAAAAYAEWLKKNPNPPRRWWGGTSPESIIRVFKEPIQEPESNTRLRKPILLGRYTDHGKYRSYYNYYQDFSLGALNFQTVMDSYTVYQELQMWFSNQASPEKPIPKISDEDMRDAKGFDKYSFKKAKQ